MKEGHGSAAAIGRWGEVADGPSNQEPGPENSRAPPTNQHPVSPKRHMKEKKNTEKERKHKKERVLLVRGSLAKQTLQSDDVIREGRGGGGGGAARPQKQP